jgi:single-strand DNA-binding protein
MQANRVELAGYLAATPELRFLPSGTRVANVRLGETYRFSGRDGKAQSHTNWHSLVFYNDLADVAISYEQGENIHVEGSLQQRKFTPTDGVTRTVHEIHVKSCHVIATTRPERESSIAHMPTESGATDHDGSWPV